MAAKRMAASWRVALIKRRKVTKGKRFAYSAQQFLQTNCARCFQEEEIIFKRLLAEPFSELLNIFEMKKRFIGIRKNFFELFSNQNFHSQSFISSTRARVQSSLMRCARVRRANYRYGKCARVWVHVRQQLKCRLTSDSIAQ